jgi:hypothetical protein
VKIANVDRTINTTILDGSRMIQELLTIPAKIESDPTNLHPCRLSLSEAVALLWQNDETGEVSGRMMSDEAHAIITYFIECYYYCYFFYKSNRNLFDSPFSKNVLIPKISSNLYSHTNPIV